MQTEYTDVRTSSSANDMKDNAEATASLPLSLERERLSAQAACDPLTAVLHVERQAAAVSPSSPQNAAPSELCASGVPLRTLSIPPVDQYCDLRPPEDQLLSSRRILYRLPCDSPKLVIVACQGDNLCLRLLQLAPPRHVH